VQLWRCRSLQYIHCRNTAASLRGKSSGVVLLGYEMQENQGGFTLQKRIISVTGAETVKTFSPVRREEGRG